MSKIVTIMLDEVETSIELPEETDNTWHLDNSGDESDNNDLTKQLDSLIASAHHIVKRLEKLSPTEAELSFGIKVGGQGKLLCFAAVNTEAQFNVKMTWRK